MSAGQLFDRLGVCELFPAFGQVTHIGAGEIEANGPEACVGAHCDIVGDDGRSILRAQVVRVSPSSIKLVPFAGTEGVGVGSKVRRAGVDVATPTGPDFAGRVVDGLGFPLDGKPAPRPTPYQSQLPQVLDRVTPVVPMATGVRAIDGLITLGRGQRIGIFAASGVGKTRLVDQLVRQIDVSRVIICQVGERGREVEELWRNVCDSGGRRRTTLVSATSDESAPMRVHAVEAALTHAEYWRDAGEDVLLVIDSITRFAMALREIGLAAGEPPTVRAYTPNVLRELPRVVERCGAKRGGGSITAICTVLSETDEVDDPIVEVMKSLLDGHIVLSRRLAQAGHFPAIDIGRSISRLFDKLVSAEHLKAARIARSHLALYDDARILIESGMYKAGGDLDLDAAVAARDALNEFLRQGSSEAEEIAATSLALARLALRRD
jgi:flagellum-specific ATP synthase